MNVRQDDATKRRPKLPQEPQAAEAELKDYNILIAGDYGVGKTGLLASTGYLIVDPEGRARTYPCLRVEALSWEDHRLILRELARTPHDRYAGIALDSLNVTYDQCTRWVMENVYFGGKLLDHPAENPQLTYPRITYEFMGWLRGVIALGWHVVATCHVDVVEVRSSSGGFYNRWIPAFVGGRASSTYGNVLRTFPIIGFMTISPRIKEVRQPTKVPTSSRDLPSVRADVLPRQPGNPRVIYFGYSLDYLTDNKLGAFPDVVELTDDWRQDWEILQAHWGKNTASEVRKDE